MACAGAERFFDAAWWPNHERRWGSSEVYIERLLVICGRGVRRGDDATEVDGILSGRGALSEPSEG